MVLASEEVARKYTDDPVWIDGVGWNVDTQYWTNRDLCYPEYLERAARMAYKMAKIEDPRKGPRLRRGLRPIRLQGAAPHGGADAR